eukprot:SAG22_NODE_274_length_13178_cov_17.793715_7_plen_58_part_00
MLRVVTNEARAPTRRRSPKVRTPILHKLMELAKKPDGVYAKGKEGHPAYLYKITGTP